MGGEGKKEAPMPNVPTIDLANVDQAALDQIDQACRDHGFFLVVNHGLEGHLTNLQRAAEKFFAQPMAAKRKVMRSADNPMGYYDRELTKQKRDLKEVFDFYAPRTEGSFGRMPWPEDAPEFRDTLCAYFYASADLSKRLLRLLCKTLGLPEDALDAAFASAPTSTARLNHYPSSDHLEPEERTKVEPLGDLALGHHTDPGAITLLYQDDVGGLETLSDEKGWIPVPPKPGAIVVNIGDIVQVWSNGQYKAAVHRVVPVPAGKSRYSMPFFYQPGSKAVIEPLAAMGAPNYRAFTWKEFIQGRIDDNYANIGEDDIQVDRYRIAS